MLDLGVRDAAEIESLLRELPSACWRELARGPRPEPECRLCDTMSTLDYIGLLPDGERARDAAIELLDYHEVHPVSFAPLDLALLMAGVDDGRTIKGLIGDIVGSMLYHRCQLIYEIARRLHYAV